MMRLVAAVLLAILPTYAIACDLVPTPADAGKVCIVNRAGDGWEWAALRYDHAAGRFEIGKELRSSVPQFVDDVRGRSFSVAAGNTCALAQADYAGVMSCMLWRDNDNNIVIGDPRRPTEGVWTVSPWNLWGNEWIWEFNEPVLPAGLTFFSMGNGGSFSFGPSNGRLVLTTGANVIGDGAYIEGNNNYTTTAFNTSAHFMGYSYSNSAVDWTFGLREPGTYNQIRFRYSAGAVASYMTVIIQNSYGYIQSFPAQRLTNVQQRCNYSIAWVVGEPLKFWGCDAYGFPVLAVEVPAGHVALPTSAAKLRPFVQVQSSGFVVSRSVEIDRISVTTPR